ncbi:MAG: hypothetical protein AAGK37_22505 [Pseudomonadota bacterium]
MDRMFDNANFAAEAGFPALDWSGIDVVEPAASRRERGRGLMTPGLLGVILSGARAHRQTLRAR